MHTITTPFDFYKKGYRIISHYIARLLYGDDILLISDSLEELQRHLNTLKSCCTDKGLLVNQDKFMVFSTTQASYQHCVCNCTFLYEIREKYHCLSKHVFGPVRNVMEDEDQWCSFCFSKKSRDIWRSCWRTTIQQHNLINYKQSQISFTISPIHATSQPWAT